MEEKRKQREDEVHQNKKYVQMVIDTDNMHKKEEADKVKRQQQKLKELQKFQMVQMGDMDYDLTGDTPSRAGTRSVAAQNIKKKKLGGPMNIDELKMNRDLLRQINEAKKAEQTNSSASKSPKKL
jgi:hypothetical protein